MTPPLFLARALFACCACALLAPGAFAASCPDGSIAMYVSGQGEFCPDASGRYTVPVSRPHAVPAPARPVPSPSDGATSSGAMQSGNVRLLQACRGLDCHVQEGWQPGLTTVEVRGQAPQYEGRSLDFVVGDVATRREVIRRKVGVLVGGEFTTSIAAYRLPAGQYVFGFRPVGGGETVGVGQFAVGQPATAKPQPAHASAGVVGTWQGVGGTMGKIELHADGTYTSNGTPAGRYQVAGNQVTFTGNLAAWNGGHATLKRPDLMEFYWKNPSGGINYFAFGKY
jgi:hypothetical protein